MKDVEAAATTKYGALPAPADEPPRPTTRYRGAAALAAAALFATAASAPPWRRPAVLEQQQPAAVTGLDRSPDPTTTRWAYRGAGAADAPVRRLEEHIVQRSAILDQAYGTWRSLAWGNIGATLGILPDDVSVDVASTEWSSAEAFLDHLEAGRVSRGAVVFLDLQFTMENDVREAVRRRVPSETLLYGSDGYRDKVQLSCAYAFSKDPALHSRVLLELLAYPEPLVLILARDDSCRAALPANSHHRLVLAQDASFRQVEALRNEGADARWWPSGFEGVGGANEASLIKAINTARPARDRDLLLAGGFSTTFRKPSRVGLGTYVQEKGGREILEQLARRTGLGLAVSSYANHGQLRAHPTKESHGDGPSPKHESTHWKLGKEDDVSLLKDDAWSLQGRSAYALAPAGDFWTTGRVLEALCLGSIPIVDATGLSEKGCADASAGWRKYVPFAAFPDAWAKLPRVLDENAEMRVAAASRIRPALAALANDLRAAALDPLNSAPSECEATAFSGDELAAIDAAAVAYYLAPRPAGAPPASAPPAKISAPTIATPWFFDAFVDSPEVPGIGCSTKAAWPSTGAYCFDPACVPPGAKSFSCSRPQLTELSA